LGRWWSMLCFLLLVSYPKCANHGANVFGQQRYVSGLHQTHFSQASGRHIKEMQHTFVLPAFKTCCWFNFWALHCREQCCGFYNFLIELVWQAYLGRYTTSAVIYLPLLFTSPIN
jgi:hypothetical protein